MENPIKTVTSNLSPGKIIGWAVVGVAVLALFNLAGLTNAFLYPVDYVKSKLNRGQ